MDYNGLKRLLERHGNRASFVHALDAQLRRVALFQLQQQGILAAQFMSLQQQQQQQ